MSGIVGSAHNIRGSGIVAKLGTDGQVFTSAGAGVSQGFEAAAGGGKIGQVVQTLKTDHETSTSDSYVSANLAVAITPAATSSKILIYVIGCISSRYSGHTMNAKIDGGNCATYIGDSATGIEAAICSIGTYDTRNQHSECMMYLDAPDTTSEVTYTLHWRAQSAGSGLNMNGPYTQATNDGNTATTMTVMEVLA